MIGQLRFATIIWLTIGAIAAGCANNRPVVKTAPSTVNGSRANLTCARHSTYCSTSANGVHLTVTGQPSAPIRVEPPPGDPLSTIDRDAGIAARLRDGSILWLFGDTAARNEAGSIDYFVIGTAAWAAPHAPTVTLDHRDPSSGTPTPFATPTADMAPCPLATQQAGMWPASAIVEPVGDRDRVLIWFHAICLDNADGSVVDMGMAIGEWWYDPASPPTSADQLTATILNQRLFKHRGFGSASVIGSDGTAFVYSCDSPIDPTDRERFGPCRVATTTLEGSAGASGYGPASEMAMPSADFTDPYPAGPFSVAYDPAVGQYVMVYSPWPGRTSFVNIRVAADPTGPWSTPVAVTLEGCDDTIGARQLKCYAANAQPAFSTPGHLGIGYYDSAITKFPTRGAYTVVTVPIDVSLDN